MNKKKTLNKHDQLLLKQVAIRTVVCCAAGSTVLAGMSLSHPHSPALFLAISIFIYTAASYFWMRKCVGTEFSDIYFSRLMLLDAIVIGVVISFLGFALLPSILFFTMVQFNSLFNGGARKWLTDNIGLIVGAAVTFFISQPAIAFTNSIQINAISMIGVTAYFYAYALYAYTQIKKLEEENEALARGNKQQKMRTYQLSRYLTPTVWKAINEGREKELSTERKRITIFFSDIQGFSSLSEELEAETLTEILNSYLNAMNKIVNKHNGTIDKFMGDGVMVLFGDAESKGIKADCLKSIAMAVEMRRKMKELQTTWLKLGVKKPLQIRMGINTGYCTVGSFGTNHYMDYTVLGTHVNLASRLESAAQPGEILISHDSWALVKDVVMCRDKGEIRVKGFTHPVKVYQVADFRKDLGKQQNYFEENMDGFSIHLDLDKLKNYDKSKIVNYLEQISERVQDKIH